MDWLGAAIGGTIGFLGSKKANQSSAKMAREQMDFQERMSSTAHQREVADLRAAGLNPILSGTGGAGSATPSGAIGQVENVGASTVNSAEAGGRTGMQKELTDNLKKTGDLLLEQKRREHEQIYTTHQQGLLTKTDERLREQEIETERHRTEQARHEASIAASSAKGWQVEGEIDETAYGRAMRHADRAAKALNGVSSAGQLGRGLRMDRYIRDGK